MMRADDACCGNAVRGLASFPGFPCYYHLYHVTIIRFVTDRVVGSKRQSDG